MISHKAEDSDIARKKQKLDLLEDVHLYLQNLLVVVGVELLKEIIKPHEQRALSGFTATQQQALMNLGGKYLLTRRDHPNWPPVERINHLAAEKEFDAEGVSNISTKELTAFLNTRHTKSVIGGIH
ncbi:MAG TPA: hypothetical protein ENJ17_01135 [Gammaproteobacteria bacterium]|nr:hypothetical protein [Gammaproteobacteria bacterium]